MFPISNWTELDIWQYIGDEEIELPSIYYAHQREVFRRDGMLLAVTPFVTVLDDEEVETPHRALPHRRRRHLHRRRRVDRGQRRRGDRRGRRQPRITERGATRADDRFTEAAMEDRKQEGYF